MSTITTTAARVSVAANCLGGHTMLLSARDSLLLIVDVQERLAPAIEVPAGAVDACERLIRAAVRLDVPVLATEHYSQGIGRTLPRLRRYLQNHEIHEKICFSAASETAFMDCLDRFAGRTIILAGMEAHVCVLQTGLGLARLGWPVAVAADAVGSRTADNHRLGLERMARHGIDVVSTEMVMFEWLERGGTEAFRDVLPLIKAG